MAGSGPAPNEKTRRRNAERFDELPAEGHTGAYPKLPANYRDGKSRRRVPFLKETKDWYETWARSPMATTFTDVHWQRLQRVARVVDQYERTCNPALLSEIRLQEAAFGGTPLDLRRLGMKIAPRIPDAESGPKRGTKSRTSAGRRARLTVVPDAE